MPPPNSGSGLLLRFQISSSSLSSARRWFFPLVGPDGGRAHRLVWHDVRSGGGANPTGGGMSSKLASDAVQPDMLRNYEQVCVSTDVFNNILNICTLNFLQLANDYSNPIQQHK